MTEMRELFFDFDEKLSKLKNNRIYRFRRFDRDNEDLEVDAIANSYLYAPTFYMLNDPMEAFFGTISYVKQGESIQDAIDKGAMLRDSLSDLNNEIGIISFADSLENMAMWAYYAANFTGICLEFSVTDLCLGDLFGCGPFEVKYSNEAPDYHHVDRTFENNYADQKFRNLITKHSSWRHESEWRFLVKPGKNYYPSHALKRIWVGPKCECSDWFIEFGMRNGIEIYNTIAQDYKLIPAARHLISNFALGENYDVIRNYISKQSIKDLTYINNINYFFDNNGLRKNFKLLSINEGPNELIILSEYTYTNGKVKRFTEIFRLEDFKSRELRQSGVVPKKIIAEN